MRSVVAALALFAVLHPRLVAQERDVAGCLEALHRGEARAGAALARHGAAAVGPLLDDLERAVRTSATRAVADLRALSAIGSADAAALERLVALLERLDNGDASAHTLLTRILRTLGDLAAHVGEAPKFAAWLERQPPDPYRQAMVRPGGAAAANPIVARTELSRVETRWQHRQDRTLPQLLRLVESDDADAAELAAERLVAFGPEARAALPALLRLLQSHPEPTVRVRTNRPAGVAGLPHATSEARVVAAVAIVAIAPRGDEALAAQAVLLQHGAPEQRLLALAALRERGEVDARTVALVARLCTDRDTLLAREAVTTLGALGPAARSAAPALERLLKHRDAPLAAAARTALRQVRER
jgi:hypothetical protein